MNTEFDVVVLGSGAAGLVAAVAAADSGASVGLFEKADLVGGTTALSGGTTWIPANPHQPGGEDSRADALAYLESLSHGLIDPGLAAALVDTGPAFIEWVERATPVRFHVVTGMPDYHPEHPGGKPGGGRSLDPALFRFGELGKWADRVVMPDRIPRLTLTEAPLGGGTGIAAPPDRATRKAEDWRGCGHALVGGLLKALLDRGIEPVTSARATGLLREDSGRTRRVAGVRLEMAGSARTTEVTARRGVIIATGGFEWDPDLVRAFLRGPMTSPASVPPNTGDGLRMAMEAGAALANMREAWWVPTVEIPGDEAFGRQRARLVLRERTLPRSIMVNRQGRRFCDEAANYNALGGAFHQFDPGSFDYANLPCWLVFDQGYLRRYGFLTVPPGGTAPGWLHRAGSVEDLAGLIGIPARALRDTVTRWNAHVEAGRDPDFRRGDSAYDGWNGDRDRYPGHGATLGPLTEPPFYAVPVHSGTLGTKGGPRTDADARVFGLDGAPIDGLYAAGNVMAGVTGMVYGGAGGTLGPAMVFGYRAGRHAAGRRAP
ncbi:MAG: FAD-dependent oxidoreductase [Streptosporangiales bacterium]|nr:FAD-dependent oxidoreductase [Streptosporangiales bacterium]